MNLKNESIFLAGHNGLVGSSVYNLLKKKSFKKIFTVNRNKLDLTNQAEVFKYLKKIKPANVIICAAQVGGIKDNMLYPANFIYQNLMIQNNLIHGAYISGVKNLIFLGSSCIYPKFAYQPIKEMEFLNGKLETSNQSYAVAKIAGVEMCKAYNQQFNTNYKCLMPSNLYGPNDNYNLQSSHFFAAAVRKIYEAKIKNKKKIHFWGSGKPKREALFVDDLADGIIFFLSKKINQNLINIGSGFELSIKQYIKLISEILNYEGEIIFNNNKKFDGTPRKIVDNTLAHKFGWKAKHKFVDGIKITINDFIKNKKNYLKDK
tara:strand:- start:231 stop:1184 length:954 start_codon:yes stop_codon:yes gene_type:complete